MTNLSMQKSALTMSSREIAELTGSAHDNVMKTIRALVEKGIVFGNETPYVHPQNKQTYSEFRLNYRDTMVVVSGYSVELRARIIDRWQELETQSPAPAHLLPSPVGDILLVYEAIARVPGVNPGIAMSFTLDAIQSHTGLPVTTMRKALPGIAAANAVKMNAGELASLFGLSARSINPILAELGLQAKDGKDWILTGTGAKYGEMIPYTNRGHSGYQALWHESVFEALRERLGPPDIKKAA